MKAGPPGSFGAQLKALREAAGYTQEELATVDRTPTLCFTQKSSSKRLRAER